MNSLEKVVDFSRHHFKGKFIGYTCFAYCQNFTFSTLQPIPFKVNAVPFQILLFFNCTLKREK